MSSKPPQNFYALMLGLPKEITEPDHYQLLDLPRFTDDPARIRSAAAIQNGKLLKWQNSEYFQSSMDLLREVVEAKRVLETPNLKQEYDTKLKRQLNQSHRKLNAALVAGWSFVVLIGGGLIYYAAFHHKGEHVAGAPDAVAESSQAQFPETDLAARNAEDFTSRDVDETSANTLPKNETPQADADARTDSDEAKASENARSQFKGAKGESDSPKLQTAPPKPWQITSVAPNREVRSVAWHPTQELVAVAADDYIRMYEITDEGYKLQNVLAGHDWTVHSVDWSPDGKRIASASRDATVRLWNLDGTRAGVFRGHGGGVNDVAWSPDGRWLVSASGRGIFRLWKPEGTEGPSAEAHARRLRCVAWSPDSKRFVTAGDDRVLKIWRLDGSLEREIDAHETRIFSLDWSPDGKRIVSGDQSGNVRLWNANDGKLIRELKIPRNQWHNDAHDLAFNPDGNRIAIGLDLDLGLWSGEDEEPSMLEIDSDALGYDVAGAACLSWSPDGRRIITGASDGSLQVFQADGPAEPRFKGNFTFPQTVRWSPDGSRIAAGLSDWTVRVWKPDGTQRVVLQGHERNRWHMPKTVSWSPDGSRLVSEGFRGKVWTAEGELLHTYEGFDRAQITSVAWHPEKPLIAAGGRKSDPVIRLWRPDGSIDAVLEGHTSRVDTVAWSPDGARLVSGSGQHRDPDGKLIKDNTVRIWSAEGKLQATMEGHSSHVQQVDWSPDGQWIASASRDYTVRLWKPNGSAGPVLPHPGWVRSVGFSPDSRRLVSACDDDNVRIWNIEQKQASILQGHRTDVMSVHWHPQDENLVASASTDGTIRTWNVQEQQTERIIFPVTGGKSVTLDRSGRLLEGDAETLEEKIIFVVKEADEVRHKLAQLERDAEQTGQPIDAQAARNLYARTRQWDKACEAYLKATPSHPFTLLLLYETGRYEEFRKARKKRLSNYTSIQNGWLDWEYARFATLLSVEPELHKHLEILASANSPPDVTEWWRNYLVARLMYRLGKFPAWHADLPEDSLLRRNQNQLLEAIVQYQQDDSDQNRQALKEQLQAAVTRLRQKTQDGVLNVHWHEYILDLSMIREAGNTLGGFDAIRFLTPDELRHELIRHERGSRFPQDDIALLHLSVCNRKWEKAAEISSKAIGPLEPLTLMLWHRAGRLDKYLAGRKAVLKEFEKLKDEDYFPYAQMAVLHSIEADLRPAIEHLARANREANGPGSWKNRRMVGFLMDRVGEFSGWYAALPEDSNLRTIETRLLAPMARFQSEPTDENRIALEEQIDWRDQRVQNFYYRDGLLKPHPSLEHYCWNLFDTALVREARRTLNPGGSPKSSVE